MSTYRTNSVPQDSGLEPNQKLTAKQANQLRLNAQREMKALEELAQKKREEKELEENNRIAKLAENKMKLDSVKSIIDKEVEDILGKIEKASKKGNQNTFKDYNTKKLWAEPSLKYNDPGYTYDSTREIEQTNKLVQDNILKEISNQLTSLGYESVIRSRNTYISDKFDNSGNNKAIEVDWSEPLKIEQPKPNKFNMSANLNILTISLFMAGVALYLFGILFHV